MGSSYFDFKSIISLAPKMISRLLYFSFKKIITYQISNKDVVFGKTWFLEYKFADVSSSRAIFDTISVKSAEIKQNILVSNNSMRY
jgi:hypothetical protein